MTDRRFLYEIPSPVTTLNGDQTHVLFRDIEVTPETSIRLQGDLGTLRDDGSFKPDPDYANGRIVRSISGEEYAAYMEYVDEQRSGAASEGTATFYGQDVGYWLTTYGWRDQNNSWTPPEDEEGS